MNKTLRSIRAFTLIELLVVVLIIGILAAIAIPQYQKAVYKSRFSALMPITKAIADGNEAYYMAYSTYADDPSKLDIKGKNSYSDGTQLTMHSGEDYAYVMASRTNYPDNRYLIYQQHSPNYAGDTHCEAKIGDSRAQWLCETLGGRSLDSGSDGYIAYVLKGSGEGFSPVELREIAQCENASELGFTCHVTEHEDGSSTRKSCVSKLGSNYCSVSQYDADGKRTQTSTCVANEQGVCIGGEKEYKYTDGKLASVKTCTAYDGAGNCTGYTTTDYNYQNGQRVSTRTCDTYDANGECTHYSTATEYGYYADGKTKYARTCDTYDANEGCTHYSTTTEYEYYADGNLKYNRTCTGEKVTANGACDGYNSGVEYEYNEDGSYREKEANDYSSGLYSTVREYNAAGNKMSYCNNSSTGYCVSYRGAYEYLETHENHSTTRRCSGTGVDAGNGSCIRYNRGYNFSYDDDGRRTTAFDCYGSGTVNPDDGSCITYTSGTAYIYDEYGNQIGTKTCSAFDGLTCTNWQ